MSDDLSPLWDKLEALPAEDTAAQLEVVRDALAQTNADARGEFVGWRLELMRLLDQELAGEADEAIKTLREMIGVSSREGHENDWIRLQRHLGTALLHHPNANSTDPNGVQALAALNRKRCQVIVSDLKMPRMDGMGFLKEVLVLDAEIPVILMTAFGTVSSAVEAMKLGAFDYIQKPFEAVEIALLVDRRPESLRAH